MNTADVRINARLTGDDANSFQTLLKHSGRSASDLLREALREYHAHQFAPRRDPVELLSDFVGAGEGPEDLSACYKRYLGDGWRTSCAALCMIAMILTDRRDFDGYRWKNTRPFVNLLLGGY